MEKLCNGFEDWLFCTNCPYLCTKACPFERENVIDVLKEQFLLKQLQKKLGQIKACLQCQFHEIRQEEEAERSYCRKENCWSEYSDCIARNALERFSNKERESW